MEWSAKWLKPASEMEDIAPVYLKSFPLHGKVQKASLFMTALGVYEAKLNGKRVGEFILAPGWTAYPKRLQYQEYDVTDLLENQNELEVTVGKGWYGSPLSGRLESDIQIELMNRPSGLLVQLEITYESGEKQTILSDDTWTVSEGPVRFAEIYDGEIYDANVVPEQRNRVEIFEGPYETLIPQQGEEIRKQETVAAADIFVTPKGEIVIDFGQEITGYVVVSAEAKAGEVIDLSFAEVLDKEGNFYTENYRAAKAQYRYICRDGYQTYEPILTFWGFRYIRINSFPGGVEHAGTENFTAVAVYSDLKRTGNIRCSDTLLNRLFDNIIWGQKCNFLDVPTDCPQRDERLGWTGDAQVFVRTACLNYDVEKFFTKWLADMAAEQGENGSISRVVPETWRSDTSSAAWGDAAVICPWQVYLAYGNPEILERQYASMCRWVEYITNTTKQEYLWIGGEHFGDWLGLDAPAGSYKGSSRDDLIASAFYAYSVSLLVKAGKVLGKDVEKYEVLYQKIKEAFHESFPTYHTQTECALAVYFGLAKDVQGAADQLADMVRTCGSRIQTGFVGTPYILHALSEHGYSDLAYTLLLRKEYPSWLYPVTRGATTIWEHWDGIMENGDFWSADMNSFNHYAYGAVADWVYTVAAGIQTVEAFPGYEKVKIAPIPDSRLEWLEVSLETRHGQISSYWKKSGRLWRYEITTPVEAEIVIGGKTHHVSKGTYYFYSPVK